MRSPLALTPSSRAISVLLLLGRALGRAPYVIPSDSRLHCCKSANTTKAESVLLPLGASADEACM
jgi:hypothetical protein